MTGPLVNIVDESFDSSHAHRFRLLLQINHTSIAIAALNHAVNKYVLLKEYKFPKGKQIQSLQEIFSENEFISNFKYKDIAVAVASSKATLVPAPFYSEQDNRKMLALNHALAHDDAVYSNHVRAYDLYTVFGIGEELNKLLKIHLGAFSPVHSTTALLEGIHLEYSYLARPSLFVNVNSGFFELVVTNGKQLLLCNTFEFTTPEDFIYYLLFAAEQLKINPEVNPVMLSGAVQRDDDLYKVTYQYFRHVNFMDRPDQYKYHYGFEKLPSHAYFSVFNLALCGS